MYASNAIPIHHLINSEYKPMSHRKTFEVIVESKCPLLCTLEAAPLTSKARKPHLQTLVFSSLVALRFQLCTTNQHYYQCTQILLVTNIIIFFLPYNFLCQQSIFSYMSHITAVTVQQQVLIKYRFT